MFGKEQGAVKYFGRKVRERDLRTKSRLFKETDRLRCADSEVKTKA
jgi:hypothetical protein